MTSGDRKRALVLGHTGKMGTALCEVLPLKYEVVGVNRNDFDANDWSSVETIVRSVRPRIVFNTVAFLGIDACEEDPDSAFRLNSLFPADLSDLSNQMRFVLVHFSTDAVFDDQKQSAYVESDRPNPINLYGLSKYAGDRLVASIAKNYVILRVPILFGPSNKSQQFVEAMIGRVQRGERLLRIASDIVSSPSYSIDVATEALNIVESNAESGTYHIANQGVAPLNELITEFMTHLDSSCEIEAASYRDFQHVGRKNRYTPLTTTRRKPLRSWQAAVRAYCGRIQVNNSV